MMSCPICYPELLPYEEYGDRLCWKCLQEARSVIAMSNKIQIDKLDAAQSVTSVFKSHTPGFANAVKVLKEAKGKDERLTYLSECFTSFATMIPTDITVNGNSGSPIRAHRALLVRCSSIFKTMLESAESNAPEMFISLPELNHEELKSLLEFLYSGTLPEEKIEKHVIILSFAANKYDIKYLQRFCENHLIGSLSTSNALTVLEISDVYSNKNLKETALNFIVKNVIDIILSEKLDDFVLRKPHLAVTIMRESVLEMEGRTSI